MSYRYIKVDISNDSICTIFLSRPKNRNAFTEAMRRELVVALDTANRDPKVRAIILTGDPEGRAFCAGADLSSGDVAGDFAKGGKADVKSGRGVNNATFRDGGGIAALAILRSLKPVIAAINGPAVGVGATISCACDIRIVAEKTKFGFVFVRRGLACESISSWMLPRLIGLGHAQELVLTGRILKPEDAPQGLFNHIVPSNQVLDKARDIAKEIALNTSAVSVALSRISLLRNSLLSPEESHLVESRIIHYTSQNPDAAEGVTSFLEKRAPKFQMDPFKDLPEFYPWWSEVNTESKL